MTVTTVYRKPIDFTCPFCEGKGEFAYNGYKLFCKTCDGTGKLHNAEQTVLAVCRVRIRRIIASIGSDNTISIKYKVDCSDFHINVRNRYENMLFKTFEEAENYCTLSNSGNSTPSF